MSNYFEIYFTLLVLTTGFLIFFRVWFQDSATILFPKEMNKNQLQDWNVWWLWWIVWTIQVYKILFQEILIQEVLFQGFYSIKAFILLRLLFLKKILLQKVLFLCPIKVIVISQRKDLFVGVFPKGFSSKGFFTRFCSTVF